MIDSDGNIVEKLPKEIQPKWTNAPTVTDLKKDFTAAQGSHSVQVGLIDKYLDNLLIRGSAVHKGPQYKSKIVPKLIRKQAEWRYAALSEPFLSTEDVFNIDPVTYEDKLGAEQNALVLNNQFNTKLSKVAFIDNYVRTCVNEGTVIVRVGWRSEKNVTVEDENQFEYVPTTDPLYIGQLHQAAQLAMSDPDTFLAQVPPEMQEAVRLSAANNAAYYPSFTGTKEVEATKIIKNEPTLDICNYNNLIIDPSCEGILANAKFVIYNFETSIGDLKKEGDRYSNLDVISIDDNNPLAAPDHSSTDNTMKFTDDIRKRIVAYEYWGEWDIEDDGVLVPFVATWVGQTLIRLELNPYPDQKIPFVAVPYLPVKQSVYGEPDGSLLEDNQKIVAAVTRGAIDTMARSAAGQKAIANGALELVNRKKYDAGKDFEFNPGLDPRGTIIDLQYPELPASIFNMISMQNNDAESLTGVKQFTGGLGGDSLGTVAAGVRGVLDAASKRELGILRRLGYGMEEIGRKIIAMNAVFLSEEEVVRVTNEKFEVIRRDDLSGNFDLRLSISTAEADDKKAEELAFMLQTMGVNMNEEMSRMLLADIAHLRKMPALSRKIEQFEPKPDPMVVKIQELEILELESKIALNYSIVQENAAESILDNAKAITERAKAKKTNSEANKTDLDLVEQESGVEQERALQLVSQQAESQGKTKVLEAIIKGSTEPKS